MNRRNQEIKDIVTVGLAAIVGVYMSVMMVVVHSASGHADQVAMTEDGSSGIAGTD